MEKQVKNILSRIRKINKIIQQPSFNNKNNEKTIFQKDQKFICVIFHIMYKNQTTFENKEEFTNKKL